VTEPEDEEIMQLEEEEVVGDETVGRE
jgi:hypothetical protein